MVWGWKPCQAAVVSSSRGNITRVALALGRGLLAGAAGTAVMTAVQRLEMRATGRGPSDVPTRALSKTLHIQPHDEQGRRRLGEVAHWGYGTSWGLVRALLAELGLRGRQATAAHLGAVWGTGLVVLPAMGLVPPPHRWGIRSLLHDLLHHATYATATGLAFDWMRD